MADGLAGEFEVVTGGSGGLTFFSGLVASVVGCEVWMMWSEGVVLVDWRPFAALSKTEGVEGLCVILTTVCSVISLYYVSFYSFSFSLSTLSIFSSSFLKYRVFDPKIGLKLFLGAAITPEFP